MNGERAEELEEPGIVWDAADAGFAETLAAARAYDEQHGAHALRHPTALDRAVGQWRPGQMRPLSLA